MGKDSCACTHEGSLATMTATSVSGCDVACAAIPAQMCGDGSVLLAHRTGKLIVYNLLILPKVA